MIGCRCDAFDPAPELDQRAFVLGVLRPGSFEVDRGPREMRELALDDARGDFTRECQGPGGHREERILAV
jgi:hypothetical protein